MEEILTTGTTEELVSEITETETTETTTTTAVDLSNLASVNVDLLNNFLYIGTSFILAVFFWFVCKLVYRLFNIFF